MEAIKIALERSLNLLATMGIADIVDILLVAYLIYKAIWFVRRTNSYNLAKGILVFLIVMLIANLFRLKMISYVLRKAAELGLIALVILFQPELRRLLERMGSSFSASRSQSGTEMDSAIAHTVLACTEMSASKTGALIIFERNVKLNEIMSTGTIINADTNAELIKNIFFNKAPLHDGALIIRAGRLAAAGCVLPLTKSTNLSKELGMRHRAGIGLSEQSDAVVVIVSEETGAISVAIDGMLKRHLTAATFERLLRSELIVEEADDKPRGFIQTLKKLIKGLTNETDKHNEKTV
ncbi:MAG: diadenylate cyclase CdaA [Oscillospiraceae bacterium]|nr:diadenylate cyclase CdaA [Oscillospiraceae bacterium]